MASVEQNRPINDAKDHLSHLKTEISNNYAGNAYTEGKVDEIKRTMDRTKLQEAEQAADQADAETLNALAQEITEAEDELSTFAETENVPGAQEFKDETLHLKTVIAEKIREKQTPKTFTDRLGEMAEKVSQGVANIMEKINDWASKLSLSALNGLKMLASMLGFESAALFLNRFMRPAEVRNIIADNIPADAEVVRDATDADSLKKLEKAYELELKRRFPEKKEEDKTEEEKKDTRTPADKFSFIDFCKKRAENLPQDKKKYSIKDLLLGNEQPDTPDAEEAEKPEQPVNPEDAPEKADARKAAYIFALAETLTSLGLTVKTPSQQRQAGANMDMRFSAQSIKNKKWVEYALKAGTNAVQATFRDPTLYEKASLKISGNSLCFEDGAWTLTSPVLIDTFNLRNDPETMVKTLLAMKVENDMLIPGGGRNSIQLSASGKAGIEAFLSTLKEKCDKYEAVIPS